MDTCTTNSLLHFVTPVTSGSVGAIDGNSAPHRTAILGTISGLNMPNGGSLWIRRADFNASGSDDALAIDDFSVIANQANAATAPGDLHLDLRLALLLALAAVRRAA